MKLRYGPYSHSRLETATCGYAFKRQYIDEDGRQRGRFESLPQARGSAAHEILEQITKKMCAEEAPVFSEAEIRAWATDAITRHPAAYQDVESILAMARLYVQKPPPVLTRDAQTELKFAVKLEDGEFVECDYEDPDALVRSRADILFISDDTTTAMVYDHKTQPNIEEADTAQMGLYAWAISKIHPYLSEIRTVLHFARYGKFSEPYIWRKNGELYGDEKPGSVGNLKDVEDNLLTRVGIVESRTSWEPTPHNGCQYCPFIAECPAMKEMIEVDAAGSFQVKMNNLKILGNTQKAVKLAGIINVMEETLKSAKSELKEFVKMAGTGIAIPGKVYEFRAGEEKVDWDKVNKKQAIRDAAYEIFENHGIDPKSYMGFSQTFSKDVWLLADEGLLKDLSALFPRTRETEFKGYKI